MDQLKKINAEMNYLPFSNKELAAGLVTERFVRNLKVSVQFYTSLGFKTCLQSEQSALLSWDNSLLLLTEHSHLPASCWLRSATRIVVPNVDDYYQYVCREKLPVFQRIGNRNYGLRDFTVLDPDGSGLRFASPIAPLDPHQYWLDKLMRYL